MKEKLNAMITNIVSVAVIAGIAVVSILYICRIAVKSTEKDYY